MVRFIFIASSVRLDPLPHPEFMTRALLFLPEAGSRNTANVYMLSEKLYYALGDSCEILR